MCKSYRYLLYQPLPTTQCKLHNFYVYIYMDFATWSICVSLRGRRRGGWGGLKAFKDIQNVEVTAPVRRSFPEIPALKSLSLWCLTPKD